MRTARRGPVGQSCLPSPTNRTARKSLRALPGKTARGRAAGPRPPARIGAYLLPVVTGGFAWFFCSARLMRALRKFK